MTMQTMARPIIRPAQVGDLAVLRAVVAAANEEFRYRIPDTLFRSYLASAMDIEGRRRQGAAVLVAELAGRLVGSISYYADANDEGMGPGFPPRTSGIRATAVHPDARGTGLGRALVDACIDLAATDRSSSIALHTAAFMEAAIRLYERSGFLRAAAYDYPVGDFFPSDQGETMVAIAFTRPIG